MKFWSVLKLVLAGSLLLTLLIPVQGVHAQDVSAKSGEPLIKVESLDVTISTFVDDSYPRGVGFLAAVEGSDPETLEVVWNFGDGVRDDISGVLTYHTYAESGTYTVTASVQVPSGRVAEGVVTVTVEDAVEPPPPPPLFIEIFAQPGVTGDPRGVGFFVAVDGIDPETLEVVWDFGDGNRDVESGVLAYYTYAESGTYTATVSVEAPDGRSAEGWIIVEVEDAIAPPPPAPLFIEIFAQSGVSDDPRDIAFFVAVDGVDPETAEVVWDFGDGTRDEVSGVFTYHTYAESGTYTATVSVQTPDGRSAEGWIIVEVEDTIAPPPPAPLFIEIFAQPNVSGDPLGVAFLVSVAGADSDTAEVVWDFGDGTRDALSGVLAYHTYAESGTYRATVSVQTPDGRSAEGWITVTLEEASVRDVEPGPTPDVEPGPTPDAEPGVTPDVEPVAAPDAEPAVAPIADDRVRDTRTTPRTDSTDVQPHEQVALQ